MPHGGPFVPETSSAYDKWAQATRQPGLPGSCSHSIRGSRQLRSRPSTRLLSPKASQGKASRCRTTRTMRASTSWNARTRRAAIGSPCSAGRTAATRPWSPHRVRRRLYQCVVAGAAVSDPNMQVNYYRFRMQCEAPREESGAHVGRSSRLAPRMRAEKVNVPDAASMHGERRPAGSGRTTPRKYLKLLDRTRTRRTNTSNSKAPTTSPTRCSTTTSSISTPP